jgi:hypothetical protein
MGIILNALDDSASRSLPLSPIRHFQPGSSAYTAIKLRPVRLATSSAGGVRTSSSAISSQHDSTEAMAAARENEMRRCRRMDSRESRKSDGFLGVAPVVCQTAYRGDRSPRDNSVGRRTLPCSPPIGIHRVRSPLSGLSQAPDPALLTTDRHPGREVLC